MTIKKHSCKFCELSLKSAHLVVEDGMSDYIKHLTEETFSEETKHGVVLVDFYADWCGPCRMMTPILESVAKDMKGKAVIGKLDIDNAQKIAAQFQVTSIPTLILFHQGKERGRLVGLRDATAIKEFIESTYAKK